MTDCRPNDTPLFLSLKVYALIEQIAHTPGYTLAGSTTGLPRASTTCGLNLVDTEMYCRPGVKPAYCADFSA